MTTDTVSWYSIGMVETTYTPFSLGSVVTGTHRIPDLLDVFAGVLADLDTGSVYAALIAEADALLAFYRSWEEVTDREPEEYLDMDQVHGLISDLGDALNGFAPPYVYFGTHPGDGADFGFWVDTDQIEDDCRIGDLRSGDERPYDLGPNDLFLVVSDHGNMTLYRGETELWGCV